MSSAYKRGHPDPLRQLPDVQVKEKITPIAAAEIPIVRQQVNNSLTGTDQSTGLASTRAKTLDEAQHDISLVTLILNVWKSWFKGAAMWI